MARAAGLPWSQPGWRARAQAWIDGQVEWPRGDAQEVKIRPWSAVLRQPTGAGDVYFKANLPALANEPELTRRLHRICPQHVLGVVAEEPGEGWMLQADGGPTLGSVLDDRARLEGMLAVYAEVARSRRAGSPPAAAAWWSRRARWPTTMGSSRGAPPTGASSMRTSGRGRPTGRARTCGRPSTWPCASGRSPAHWRGNACSAASPPPRRASGGRPGGVAARPGDGARPPVSAWTFTPMTQAEAEEIAGWRYPGEYAFYDADFIPEGLGELLDPEQRRDEYHSARNADGELEGFAQLSPDRGGATEIGLGLRPDLTGRGLGRAFTAAVIDLARRHGAGRITLAVAAFNARAIRVYERCGFAETGRHTRRLGGRDWEFVDMALESGSDPERNA